MQSTQIRAYRPSDLPAISAATAQTAWEHLTPAQQARCDRSHLVQRALHMVSTALRSPQTFCAVAENQGEVVGYEIVSLRSNELTGLLEGLKIDGWVSPYYRGHGLNYALHHVGETWCRQQGARCMTCVVSAHNAASLRATDKAGFETERVIRVKWL